MRTKRALTRLVVIMAVSCLGAVAACGGGDNGGGSTGKSGQPATIKVGTIPIVDTAPLYLGIQKGFFKQEKLTVEPKPAQGGAAIVPAVLSGSNDIGFSNVTSLIIASSKGLPVQIIAQGVQAGAGEQDAFDALLVPKNSPITSPK